MRFLNKKAFSVIEYAVLFVIVVGAMVAMRDYLQRGIYGNWGKAGQSIAYGRQYDSQSTIECDYDESSNQWYDHNCYASLGSVNSCTTSICSSVESSLPNGCPINGVCTSWGPCNYGGGSTPALCGQSGVQNCLTSTLPQCGGVAAPTNQNCIGTQPDNDGCSGYGACYTSECPPGQTCTLAACGTQGVATCLSADYTPPSCGGSTGAYTSTCSGSAPNCGSNDCGTDSCGNSCGTCPSGQACNSITAGMPGNCVCSATTCAAAGKNCGNISNGCGGSLNCGSCSSPQSCGGGGTPNVCGGNCPVTTPCSVTLNCGEDNCGHSCGTCAAGYGCNTTSGPGSCVVTNCNSCQSWIGNSCVTTVPCGTSNCGFDSCGRSCGTCTGGKLCSSTDGPGQCVSGCQGCQTSNGVSCESTVPCGDSDCGTDSCGNVCGNCPGAESCSSNASGMPGMCGCVPLTPCNDSTCGYDDCGNSCGNCPTGDICNSFVGPGSCIAACPACKTWSGTACVTTATCGTHSNCGTDSCGNPCPSGGTGGCPAGQTCSSSPGSGLPGTCSGTCTPTLSSICSSSNGCGVDSCGNSCGTCPGGVSCNIPAGGTSGTCQGICTPAIPCSATHNCGTDSCGNVCQYGESCPNS